MQIEIQSRILFTMVRSHFHIQMVSFHMFSTDLENEIAKFSATWIYVEYNKFLLARHCEVMHYIRVQSGSADQQYLQRKKVHIIHRKKILKTDASSWQRASNAPHLGISNVSGWWICHYQLKLIVFKSAKRFTCESMKHNRFVRN